MRGPRLLALISSLTVCTQPGVRFWMCVMRDGPGARVGERLLNGSEPPPAPDYLFQGGPRRKVAAPRDYQQLNHPQQHLRLPARAFPVPGHKRVHVASYQPPRKIA